MDFDADFPLQLWLCSVSLMDSKYTEGIFEFRVALSGSRCPEIERHVYKALLRLLTQTEALVSNENLSRFKEAAEILQPSSDWFVFPFLIKETELSAVERNSLPSTTGKNFPVSVVFLFDSIKDSARASCV